MKSLALIALLGLVSSGSSAPAASPSLATSMGEIMESDGLVEALSFARTEFYACREDHALDIDEMMDLGTDLFRSDRRDEALALGLFLAEVRPESALVHSFLAQVAVHTGNRGLARTALARALELDPRRIGDIKLLKSLNLVPDGFIVPTLRVTADFRIRPLLGSDAELDYAAVMSSRDHLQGVFGAGDWPRDDLTLEQDRQALAGHEKEFAGRSSFTYTVMNPDETECLGCVYIYPARVDDYDAEIVFWVSQAAYDRGLDPVLQRELEAWFSGAWPFTEIVYPGRSISFAEYMERLIAQDTALGEN